MKETISMQITALKNASVEKLQYKHKELFNDHGAISDNKAYLMRRIAYRMQELEYGGLSEKAQKRLAELITTYDPVNNEVFRSKISIKTQTMKKCHIRDRRLPIPGSVIIKEYKGKNIQVKVLETGFEYNDKIYKNLTTIAEEITGAHWNGYLFFNL